MLDWIYKKAFITYRLQIYKVYNKKGDVYNDM